MKKQRVLYAKLHTNTHLPSVGDLTMTLPPTLKNYALTMYSTDQGIVLSVKGKDSKTKEALVPWGNVAIAELGEEFADEPKVTKNVK